MHFVCFLRACMGILWATPLVQVWCELVLAFRISSIDNGCWGTTMVLPNKTLCEVIDCKIELNSICVYSNLSDSGNMIVNHYYAPFCDAYFAP